jgi:hypothetical protein
MDRCQRCHVQSNDLQAYAGRRICSVCKAELQAMPRISAGIPPGLTLTGLAAGRLLLWWLVVTLWTPDPMGHDLPGLIAGCAYGELAGWLVVRTIHIGLSPWTLPLEVLAAGVSATLAAPYLPLSGTGSIAMVLPAFLIVGAIATAGWRLVIPRS